MGGGGYVAGPVGLAARTLRLPIVLAEADSHLGVTNRLLAPFAARVCLAFPVPGRDGSRYLVTGRPLPAATGAADRTAARERFELDPGAQCLLVFGGSLGARRLNDAALEAFGPAAPCSVLHACGGRDYEALRARLVAARAGGSVLELAAAGLPAILVPYPHATADHQTLNARHMEAAGAALVVPDDESDGPRLAREVGALLGAPQRLDEMSKAALAAARPDAAERIAGELIALV
jgi:UDP-N-acetylglucosamine--N-acetylmuramyl-(pentapeptide) pyrophosphoryl-undecaprenol N-acetylglucosamine transferase